MPAAPPPTPEDRESDPAPPGRIHGPHPDECISALAGRQHGAVARRQLLDAGIASSTLDDRVSRGLLVPLHRGVYAVGHRRLRSEGWWMAAVLAVGPDAVLSHRDAARLHAIRFAGGSRIDVSTPAQRRGTAGIRVHARCLLDRRDVTTVDGIPVTTVARTLVDLAEVLTHDRLVKALSEAERQWKLDVRSIEETLGRLRGRRGQGLAAIRAALAELAAHGAQLTRSELEERLVPVLDAHRLPRPRLNFHVAGMEVDAAWPAARVAVELDGWSAHHHRWAFQRDRAKSNALQAAGWVVLRYTHDDVVRRPDRVAAEIAAQLARAAPLSRAGGSARPLRPGGRRGS